MTSIPENIPARAAAQHSLRHHAVQLAGGIAGVSTIALLAAGAALPFVVSTDHGSTAAIALTALGGNALAGWLTEWAAARMQTAGWLENTTTLDDLARAIDAAQGNDDALAADMQRLLAETDALATTIQALNGQAAQQTRLLQLLAEDMQQLGFRNERLHETTYQELLKQSAALQQQFMQSHVGFAAQLAAVLALLQQLVRTPLEAVPQSTKGSRYINMAPSPQQSFVTRDDFMTALLASITEIRAHSSPKIIALRGAGGYGKSTLVSTICFHPSTRDLFPDGVLWITLGEHYDSGKLVLQIADVIERINLHRPAFQAIDAAASMLRDIIQTGRFLFVLDDLWHHDQIRPLVWPESPCVYVLTTRNHQTIPQPSHTIVLNAMTDGEAIMLLRIGVSNQGNDVALSRLAQRVGRWPLLLRLVNGALQDRLAFGQSIDVALESVNQSLDRHGVIAFDHEDAMARDQAVERTIAVSLEQLTINDQARLFDLAIFAEDADIPIALVAQLWGATAGTQPHDVEKLCLRLASLSLLLRCDLGVRTIRLHDVIRDYLTRKRQEQMQAMHRTLLDACRPATGSWADLPTVEPYMWRYLAYHLRQAGRQQELFGALQDLRFIARKSRLLGTQSIEDDINGYRHS